MEVRGLAYGLAANGLSAKLGCSKPEAQDLIDSYFSNYKQVHNWLHSASVFAVRNKFTRTLSGRMRYFEFDPRDRAQVASVEREGRNTPIQGTSADIIKLAMCGANDEYRKSSAVKNVNSVHDELVFEVDAEIADVTCARVKEIMESAESYFLKKVQPSAEAHVVDAWSEK